MAADDWLITSAASFRARAAFCSPSAAITCTPKQTEILRHLHQPQSSTSLLIMTDVKKILYNIICFYYLILMWFILALVSRAASAL